MRALVLGLIFSAAALPCRAQTVLKSEPLVLAPYEVAFVQDASCPAGKVLKVTGAISGPASQESLRDARRGAGVAGHGDALTGSDRYRDEAKGFAWGSTELQIHFAVPFGVGLVPDRIFLRVRPAGPDLVIIVQHRPWRRGFLFGYRVDHQPALPGKLPDVRSVG